MQIALEIWRGSIRPLFESIRDSHPRHELRIAFLALLTPIGQLTRGLERSVKACTEAIGCTTLSRGRSMRRSSGTVLDNEEEDQD